MIDLSMYAHKAASLQPSPKRGIVSGGIKIRSPNGAVSTSGGSSTANSSKPPVVPRSDHHSSGGCRYETNYVNF